MFSPLFYTVSTVYSDVLWFTFCKKKKKMFFSKPVLSPFIQVVFFYLKRNIAGQPTLTPRWDFDRRYLSAKKKCASQILQTNNAETFSGIISGHFKAKFWLFLELTCDKRQTKLKSWQYISDALSTEPKFVLRDDHGGSFIESITDFQTFTLSGYCRLCIRKRVLYCSK